MTPSHDDNGDDVRRSEPGLKAQAEAYFAGEMPPRERDAFERRLLENPKFAQVVYEEMGMGPVFHEAIQALRIRHLEAHARIADGSVSKQVPWWGRTRSRFVVTVTAAAVVFLVVIVSKVGEVPTERIPGEPLNLTGFRCLAPAGSIEALPAQFSWTQHPAADDYRLEIYDDSSQLVYSTITGQTTLIVAIDRLAEKGFRSGRWQVVPLDPHGAELGASASVEISVSMP